MKAAMIFPGQGSQYVGMGKDLYDEYSSVRDLYREADQVLGFSISELCFEGDPDILTQTRNAQPAILLHSAAVLKVLKEESDIEPVITAGHSLGEYSALVAAGALSSMDALKIVRRRGELMYKAGLEEPGTMAAVIGMERTAVERICNQASGSGRIVVPANINCPGQIVISGHVEAVQRAMDIAGKRGARKTVQLKVSGAFHSPLVSGAEEELVSYIKSFNISDTRIDVICNSDARAVKSSEAIIEGLSKQLTHPVLWSDSMELMLNRWKGEVIEAGPGKVLAGLMKRIDRARAVKTAGKADELKKLIAEAVDFV